MGFGEKRRRWIKWGLSTTRFFVLVNGTPTGYFQSSRGLRQRDPFRPTWLRVNLGKSELIPFGRVENVEELVEEFDNKVGRLPSTYLGMPLGAPFKICCCLGWNRRKIPQKIGYMEMSILF
ncbi:hypothetical protein CK203_024424 [Vitis vinifera]|uniref:Reverse transcriptase domain-containing protein n=1 Tax=Vitis vinifera TaxID=29760 RepID=A0A438IY43_VITVI|nr:hypothetical protein CK203_024424 [Vitis vinifera]